MISEQTIKLMDKMFELEVEHFTNNKPSSLFERQMAIKKLKIDVLNHIKERTNSIFIVKNTTANSKTDFDLCITINNAELNNNSQTRVYEIQLSDDCSTFKSTLIRGN